MKNYKIDNIGGLTLILTYDDTFCNNVIYLRKKKKVSRMKLSQLTNVTENAIISLESGNAHIFDRVDVDSMCKFFGVTEEMLLSEDLTQK